MRRTVLLAGLGILLLGAEAVAVIWRATSGPPSTAWRLGPQDESPTIAPPVAGALDPRVSLAAPAAARPAPAAGLPRPAPWAGVPGPPTPTAAPRPAMGSFPGAPQATTPATPPRASRTARRHFRALQLREVAAQRGGAPAPGAGAGLDAGYVPPGGRADEESR